MARAIFENPMMNGSVGASGRRPALRTKVRKDLAMRNCAGSTVPPGLSAFSLPASRGKCRHAVWGAQRLHRRSGSSVGACSAAGRGASRRRRYFAAIHQSVPSLIRRT